MATIMVVHGAWGGAHGFRHVRRLLQAAGHEVTTPCLTGIGERVHLAHPLVNLSTHVRDVVNHVLYEDLQGIVLLGFSYGGCVVTGALEHIAERVRHLVFLDAFVPRHGDSVAGLMRGSVPKRAASDEPEDADAKTSSAQLHCASSTVMLSGPVTKTRWRSWKPLSSPRTSTP